MSPRKASRSRNSVITKEEMEKLILERVTKEIATYKANQHGKEQGESSKAPQNPSNPCTYQNFLSFKPPIFKGTEGALGLRQWIERMEITFQLSNCDISDRVKYATCTLQNKALTWWIDISQSMGINNADSMSWANLKQMMSKNFCSRNEVHELEVEFWIHVTESLDIISRINQFHEQALFCPSFVSSEYIQLEQYIQEFPFQVQDDVPSSNISVIQTLIRSARDLIGRIKRQNIANPKSDNHKRKWENQYRQEKPESSKIIGGYLGNLPFCSKCLHHHKAETCGKPNKNKTCYRCEKVGHISANCHALFPTPKTCFQCSESGHLKSQCPRLKDKNFKWQTSKSQGSSE